MSTLRCRLGDLVVVASCPIAQNIGLFATIVQVLVDPNDTGDWVICPQTEMWGYGEAGRLELSADDLSAPDADLRPIRPQRNDAVDEMVQRVGPAPMTLTEILQGVAHG